MLAISMTKNRKIVRFELFRLRSINYGSISIQRTRFQTLKPTMNKWAQYPVQMEA